jgi:2-dehydropantoate 2-reductase
MRIAVVGTGGIGGYFGGLLAKGGNEVTFVARGENYEAIKKVGLQIFSVPGNFLVKPYNVVKQIPEIKDPELVLFTVKTYDTENAATELKPVVSENTTILTLQNGIDNDFQIKKFIPQVNVFPGVAYIVTARTAPGIINQTGGLRKIVFGSRGNQEKDKIIKINEILRNSEINAETSENINTDLWKKFILICAFSGMTGMYRKTIGEVLADTKMKSEFETCVKENIALAKMLNIPLPENIFEITMKTAGDTKPDSKSSLLVDLENNRKTEIESLNGKVVKYAAEIGLGASMNGRIYNKIADLLL